MLVYKIFNKVKTCLTINYFWDLSEELRILIQKLKVFKFKNYHFLGPMVIKLSIICNKIGIYNHFFHIE